MITIGQKLQAVRIKKNITQARLVELTGIPQSGLSNIERGKNDITVSTLIKICMALGINPAELFQNRVSEKKITFTRNRIERIAADAAGKPTRLREEEKNISKCLKILVRLKGERKAVKKIQRAWNDLKHRYSDSEIRVLTERTREAYQRLHAAKHH